MHHIVEVLATQLFLQLLLTIKIEFDEVDIWTFQVLLRTAAAHGSPCIHAPAKGFFHDE